MKRISAILMTTATLSVLHPTQAQDAVHAGLPEVNIQNGTMTPEVLWAFGRVGNLCVAPDGKQAAFTVTYYDLAENKGNADIYVVNADGSNRRQLTRTVASEGTLAWHPDGQRILFLRGGALWSIRPDNGQETKLSALELPIDGFRLSPTGDRIALLITVKLENCRASDIYSDMDKAQAYVYDELMYRHWDTWKDGNYSHVFIGVFDDAAGVSAAEDLMPGEPYDAPVKPFGGIDDIAWHPNGKVLVYTCKKLSGREYAFQTNSNLYWYDLETRQTSLLTPDMPGYDNHPLFSPDGTQLLWLSMERGGYEADKERIMIMDLATREHKDCSQDFDASPGSLQWTPDGKAIYMTAPWQEANQIHRLDLQTGKIVRLTDGNQDYQQIQIADNTLLALHATPVKPVEIFRVDPKSGKGAEISFVNKALLDKLNLPTFEKRFVTTTDGKPMVTWVVYPPAFDKSRKYPMLLMCTGGPQGVLSPSFSYRWNYMLMAAQGYVVVAPARRGTSGSGQEWCDAISRHHGTQDEADLLAATDALASELWIDEQRIGAMGASYGGFSVFHLAGTHQGRFKAFLAHAGIFQMDMMYMTTEEMFFETWETGGAPWEKENPDAIASYAHSPHLLVKNWDTPILITIGEKDFRVPYSQGMAAFNAAQMLGVESRLIVFPTENHWVLSPQNAIVWQREFFRWFGAWLKP